MADIYLRMTYVVELSDKDMRVICLALANKIKSQEDQKAAYGLNIRLLESQMVRIQEQSQKIEGALKKANEEAAPP